MPNITSLISSFKYAADNLNYYKTILSEHGVETDNVIDIESFERHVPIINKQDVFPRFNADDLFTGEQLDNFYSAIVSSGTSGIFSYGLVSREDSIKQSEMLDGLINQCFQLSPEQKIIIINALPMGVSFASSHPVVPVSTRTDIALHVIKTFGKSRQVVIITEPRLLKQLVEQGEGEGLNLSEYSISAVIGGMWFPDSLTNYLVGKLNDGNISESQVPKNQVLTTMGITELGLNIFTGTPDLIMLRSVIQRDIELSGSLFGTKIATPVLGYSLSTNFYLEVVNQDEEGVGELVVTHLDTKSAPLLIRYNTGDRVKILSADELNKINFKPSIEASVFAIYGRQSDRSDLEFDLNDIQQIYYTNADLLKNGTDNFHIEEDNGKVVVYYQLKKDIDRVPDIEVNKIIFESVPYFDYHKNMGPQFDYKWKH